MAQDKEFTPVLFRTEKAGYCKGDVTAVFFMECAEHGNSDRMTCYAHVGQHGSCDAGWLRLTRRATFAEYDALRLELESPPYNYRLTVYRRIPHTARQKRIDQIKAIDKNMEEAAATDRNRAVMQAWR